MRSILVTGSSSGIGRAIAETLLSEGHRIIGISRTPERFNPGTTDYVAYEADLSQPDAAARVFKRAVSAHPEIDGFVSNAGWGAFGSLENFSAAQIQTFIQGNLLSHMLLARQSVPHLKGLRRGDLVFMGSEAALSGAQKGSLYCTAKFGLRGLAQSLRAECGHGIRVSLINPGMVRTPFFKEQRFQPGPGPEHAIEASDVAATVSMVLNARQGTVFDEINLSPQTHLIDFKS